MMLTRESVLKLNNTEMHNGIDFEELLNILKINLRGDSNDKDFMKNVGAILNTLLPTEANVSDTNDSIRIIWLGPNEWLIQINNENKFKDIFSKLQSTLNPQYTAITDVTENRTIIKATEKTRIL